MFRAIALATVLLGPISIPAADKSDPLGKIPRAANLVFKIENPRQLVEGVQRFNPYQELEQFSAVQEYLNSTQVRRFSQIISYLEQELGSPWPELLDEVAGRGIALGFGFQTQPQPALLVIEGKQSKTSARFHQFMLTAIRGEIARTDAKTIVEQAEFEGVVVTKVGDDFMTAQIDSTILVSNKQNAIQEGIRLTLGRTDSSILTHPNLQAARKMAGDHPAAWGWLDFAEIKKSQQAQDFFATTKKDIFQTLVFGSTADAALRANSIVFVANQSPKGLSIGVRLPAKRSEIDPNMAIHVPMRGEPGSRPLLQPKGVTYSQSFYLDLGFLWSERKKIFNEQNLKDVENGVQQINKILPNTSFGELLKASGPYHRIVSATTGERLYSIEPGQVIPPTAYVGSMRDPVFGERMSALIRAGAFLASFQTGWVMNEETFEGVEIVSYRFPEKKEPNFPDPERLRFNAAPAFAVVGDSLIIGSTPGIVKLLIPELKKESKTSGTHPVWRASLFASGVSNLIETNPEQTMTQLILSQGIGLSEAREQTRKIAEYVRSLGRIELSIDHATNMYEFKIDWKYSK